MIMQTKAEFDSLKSSIDSKLARLEHIPTTNVMVAWGVGMFVAVLALVAGMMALVGDRFDNGMGSGSAIGQRFEQSNAKSEQIQRNFEQMIVKMDRIINRLDGDAKEK